MTVLNKYEYIGYGKIKLRLGFSIIITLLIALSASQIICAALGIMSYHKNTEQIFLSKYNIVQKSLIRDIEGSLRFGKELNTFLDIKDILSAVKAEHSDIRNIIIYSADKKPLYYLNDAGLSDGMGADTAGILAVRHKDLHLLSPIKTVDGGISGYVDFVGSKKSINDNVRKSAVWFAKYIFLSLLVSSGIMLLLLNYALPKEFSGNYLNKKRVAATLITLVVLTQLLSVYIINSALISDYRKGTQGNARFIEDSVGREIEMLMSKGVRVNRLIGIERALKEITDHAPEIGSITIYDGGGMPLYAPTGGGAKAGENFRPLMLNGKIAGYIHAEVSRKNIAEFGKKLLYDGLTTFVIALMFATELLIFLFAYAKNKMDRAAEQGAEAPVPYNGFMRSAAATYLFGTTLAVSFIPLYIGTLKQSGGFLQSFSSLMSSLPVSMELFFSMPMIMVAGWWMDRRGWHQPFITGCIVTSVGGLLSGAASDSSLFILARCISGAGYGLTWTSAISFVLKNTGVSDRSSAIASLVAGIITGHIAGGAVGAMLADRLGCRAVFFISAGLAAIPVIFVFMFMKDYFIKPERRPSVSVGENLLLMKKYLASRNITAVLSFSIIPYSICQMGLLLFAAPVYLHSLGVGQSDIGRVLMVYGATVVYCSPFIGRMIDRSKVSRRTMIFAGGLTGGISLFFVVFLKSAPSVIAALFIMGIASSILAASQMVYAYEQPITKEIGSGVAVSLQRFADKLGQMLGPLTLGILFSVTKIETGLGIVGMLFIAASFLFLFLTSRRKT